MKSPSARQDPSLLLRVSLFIQRRAGLNTRAPYDGRNTADRPLNPHRYRRRKRCLLTPADFREASDSLCCLARARSCGAAFLLLGIGRYACRGADALAAQDAKMAQCGEDGRFLLRSLPATLQNTQQSYLQCSPQPKVPTTLARVDQSTEPDWRAYCLPCAVSVQ
jgi:hypothetical protein